MRTTPIITRVADSAVPAILTMAAVLAITACGDGSGGTKTAEAAPPKTPAPATTTTAPTVVTTPANAGSVIPENISYAEAESAFTAKRFDEATAKFDAYTRGHPENAWGHYMLGLSAWKSGDLERAESAFDSALARDPSHVKSLVNSSRVLLELDRPKDALERVSAAVQLDPDSPDAHRVMARVHAALGDVDSALASYREALALDPEDAWSMNNMGLLLIQRGRYEEALGPLSRAVQLDDGVTVFENNLGIALERTGHLVRAGEAYRAALAIDSTNAKAQVNLARVDGRTDLPGVDSVDVGMLGDQFAAQVKEWKEQRSATAPAAVEPVTPPETTPADSSTRPDSVTSDSAKVGSGVSDAVEIVLPVVRLAKT
ncbi:MAG TPA: tetratricopeptide repeat protein [Gemmatimonadaceae bacterium]|nr:tetratricopeptide repeat protein [Gemmatimonadaceae bacterium]